MPTDEERSEVERKLRELECRCAVFGGTQRHPGKPLFACYERGVCVAVGTAQEVADAVGVSRSTVYGAVAPSRNVPRRKWREYYRFYEEDDHEDQR